MSPTLFATADAPHDPAPSTSPDLPDLLRALFPEAPAPPRAHHHPPILARLLPSPLGPMLAAATTRGIVLLEWTDRLALAAQAETLRRHFPGSPLLPDTAQPPSPASSLLDALARQLSAYFAGTLTRFDLPLLTPGTPFQQRVWSELQRTPFAHTQTYLHLARALNPIAPPTRAVARANALNRLAILIPCHRIIGSDGSLTGYAGQLWRKQRLLDLERTTKTKEAQALPRLHSPRSFLYSPRSLLPCPLTYSYTTPAPHA